MSEHSDKGTPLQIERPTTEKAHFSTVEVQAKATWRSPCSVEQRKQDLRALSVGPELNKIGRSKAQQAVPSYHLSYALIDII